MTIRKLVTQDFISSQIKYNIFPEEPQIFSTQTPFQFYEASAAGH